MVRRDVSNDIHHINSKYFDLLSHYNTVLRLERPFDNQILCLKLLGEWQTV